MSKSALRRYHEQRKQGVLRRSLDGSKAVSRSTYSMPNRAQCSQSRRVAVVTDVAHAYVGGREGEPRGEDAGASSQQFDQRQRVFPAREADEQVVALVDEAVVFDGLFYEAVEAL